ncbi:hypothetical protein K461DRAFT_319888 [Myriangium duriaei CBS 260.36]|uniref:Uncharacterized protein n=1 Tax=Myriangium duriaei CBS 260.36 TaxID=1168546 RepID=A0A9P4J1X0_9PEZI|nr:hypothetical protein K461DRAFT_319888 [Myriangium duriaei CBS 260.36]
MPGEQEVPTSNSQGLPRAHLIPMPGIHYVSSVEARAIIEEDTIIFVAYDKTWEKRILHTFKEKDGLSLYTQRPLYEELDPVPRGTTSVFDQLVHKFGDDSSSLHLLIPRHCLSRSMKIQSSAILGLIDELQSMSSKLPVIPSNIAHHPVPMPPSHPTSGPRKIAVTSKMIDPGAESPVLIDDIYRLVNKTDVF